MNLKRGFLALAAMILGVGVFGAFPQEAKADTFGGITCTPQNSGTAQNPGPYPSDGQHYFMCISSPTAAQTTRMKAHYQTINGFPHAGMGARDALSAAGVKFYYFANKTAYNSYMNAKHGSGVPGVPGPFDAGTARCGNTHGQLGTIYSAVFDTCSYQSGASETNPNVKEVAKHEGGHAWSAALAKTNGTSGPARSSGFIGAVNEDKARFDNDYAAGTAGAKLQLICGAFGVSAPSTLELDLGSTPGAVCSGMGPAWVNNYPGKTPTEIANLKLPYFVTSAGAPIYEEWWAQRTVLQPLAGGPGTPDILPITDKYLAHADNLCGTYIISYMWTHSVAPPMNSYPVGCTPRDPNTIR